MRKIRNKNLSFVYCFFFLLVLVLYVKTIAYSSGKKCFLDINKSILLGLRYSKEFKYYNDEVELQISSIRNLRRNYFPHLKLNLSQNNNINVNSGDSRSKTLSFNISQLLYDGGKLGRRINDAKIAFLISEVENRQKRIDFIVKIINQYLSILKQEERLKIRLKLFQEQQKELEVTRKKFQLGESTILDVYEWQIETEQSQIELTQLSNNLYFEKMGFNKLIGLDLDVNIIPILSLKKSFWRKINFSYNEKQVLQSALINSLEIKKALLSLKKASVNETRKKQLVPNISLNAGYSTSLEKLFRASDNWTLGLSVTIPFFSDNLSLNTSLGGDWSLSKKNIGNQFGTGIYENPAYFQQVRSENLALEKQKDDLKRKKQDVILAAKKALANIQVQQNKIKILNSKIQLSEAKLLIMRKQLNIGEIKLSEYIKFQNNLNSSKLDRLDAYTQLINQIVEINKMQGKLQAGEIQKLFSEFLEKKEE